MNNYHVLIKTAMGTLDNSHELIGDLTAEIFDNVGERNAYLMHFTIVPTFVTNALHLLTISVGLGVLS